MTFVDFLFSAWVGGSTVAVIVGLLWFLRERERGRAIKALRRQNALLQVRADEADRLHRFNEFLRADKRKLEWRLETFRKYARLVKVSDLDGKALPPATVEQSGRRVTERISAQIVEKALPEPSRNGGSHF